MVPGGKGGAEQSLHQLSPHTRTSLAEVGQEQSSHRPKRGTGCCFKTLSIVGGGDYLLCSMSVVTAN